jgi:hypothetical protein
MQSDDKYVHPRFLPQAAILARLRTVRNTSASSTNGRFSSRSVELAR